MLKYLYLTPNSLLVVLLGRGAARLLIAAMGAAITLSRRRHLPGRRFRPARIDWPLLIPSLVLGLIAIVALGIMLAAVCMQTRQESWSYPEAVAGALFLVVGAVFPIAVLPPVAQAFGYFVPLTWWLEGVRQGLNPGSISGDRRNGLPVDAADRDDQPRPNGHPGRVARHHRGYYTRCAGCLSVE